MDINTRMELDHARKILPMLAEAAALNVLTVVPATHRATGEPVNLLAVADADGEFQPIAVLWPSDPRADFQPEGNLTDYMPEGAKAA